MTHAETLVVVPCFNEAATVAAVITEIRQHVPEADVLVVDDASLDATRDEALEVGAVVLTLAVNLGVGGAMRAGYRYAVEGGYRRVVQVDGDGQHDSSQARLLLDAVDEGSDLVIGARFAGAGAYEVRGIRRFAMRLLASVLSRRSGVRLTDATSGFRACNARTARLFSKHYAAEYLGDTVEAIVLAAEAGLTVRQVPVIMRERAGGRPSSGPVKSSIFLVRVVLALLLARIRRFPQALPEETT